MNGGFWLSKIDAINKLTEVYERELVLTKKRIEDIEFELNRLDKEKEFYVGELEKNKV